MKLYLWVNYTAAPDQVPDIVVVTDSITIDDDIVTLALSWGVPFNNFDPIVNYTVSCSGDVTCPPNFTTTDNTTRSYTVTNLTPMTTYTFSVVATNSIGSGEAGVVMITTPSCKYIIICTYIDNNAISAYSYICRIANSCKPICEFLMININQMILCITYSYVCTHIRIYT